MLQSSVAGGTNNNCCDSYFNTIYNICWGQTIMEQCGNRRVNKGQRSQSSVAIISSKPNNQ